MSPGSYALTVSASFAAAHRLREYAGNCERLHGHNWRVEATVEAPELDALGMAVDFRVIKAELSAVLGRLDHGFLNEIAPFDARNPSSENLARYVFEELKGRIPAPARVRRVAVWESEDARAEYSEET